jgi:hypothetical protein
MPAPSSEACGGRRSGADVSLLLHQGDDRLALLPDQEYQHLHLLRGAGVLCFMDMLVRKVRTVSYLEGHRGVPFLLKDQCSFQDID